MDKSNGDQSAIIPQGAIQISLSNSKKILQTEDLRVSTLTAYLLPTLLRMQSGIPRRWQYQSLRQEIKRRQ